MNKNKYIDKSILCQYDLDEKLFEELNLNVLDIVPLRKVFVIFTDEGKKILKLCSLSDERVEYINKALEYIYKKDKDILKYCKNCNGNVVTKWNNKRYVVLEMIDGREANFSNPVEIEKCTEAIVKMHNASRGINDTIKEESQKYNNVIDEYMKEFNCILELEKSVEKYKYKNEFDILFLQSVDEAQKQMNKAIDKLLRSDYEKIIKNINNKVLCHNDLAHHNFIINGSNVKIIDFDYCNIDLPIMDLANYIRKVIKNLAYDKDSVRKIIESYSKISPINDNEIEILLALLMYPKEFVTISKLYYYKQKCWEEDVFINKFKSKIELDDYRKDFLLTPLSYFTKK